MGIDFGDFDLREVGTDLFGNAEGDDVRKEGFLDPGEFVDILGVVAEFGPTAAEKRAHRLVWHEKALESCQGADLVFLDPDNGLAEKEPNISGILVRANRMTFRSMFQRK